MEPVTHVEVGDCRCPGSPHPVDWVDLVPQPSVPLGAAVMSILANAGIDEAILQGRLATVYLAFGIRAWSFVDERGSPVPIRPTEEGWSETVDRLLPWHQGGGEVANAADELYSDKILRPLMSRSSMRSQGGRMAGSTSPTRPSGSTRRKQRRPSSRTATAGTLSVVSAP